MLGVTFNAAAFFSEGPPGLDVQLSLMVLESLATEGKVVPKRPTAAA